MDDFELRNQEFINRMRMDDELRDLSQAWALKADEFEYTYHFTWLGLPIIQYPQDLLAMQEIIYTVKPDLIIETGVARGGSIIFYASMLHMLNNNGRVLGIEIDLKKQNKKNIEQHFLAKYIDIIEGSSIADETISQVRDIIKKYKTILVALDSNHTKAHVLAELKLYSQFVSVGSYLVVFDTRVELTPKEYFKTRPWGPGNSPMNAVDEFLESHKNFVIDNVIDSKLQITECPRGYLKRIY